MLIITQVLLCTQQSTTDKRLYLLSIVAKQTAATAAVRDSAATRTHADIGATTPADCSTTPTTDSTGSAGSFPSSQTGHTLPQ
jgi:hypothetical protein